MPEATAVMTPVAEPAVATVVVPLAHVPPVVASVKVIVEPAHTALLVPIAAGFTFTVNVCVAEQPVASL